MSEFQTLTSSTIKIILNLTLSLSILLAPTRGYSTVSATSILTPAQEATLAEEELASAQAVKIQELRQGVLDVDRRHNSRLDPFMMLRQNVEDDRPAHMRALLEEEAIEDYVSRLTHFRKVVSELNSIKVQLEAQLNNNPEQTPQRKATEQNLNDINVRLTIAQIELNDLADKDPRDGNGLKLQSFIDTHLSRKHYFGNELQLEILDAEGREVTTVNQSDFTESFAVHFNHQGSEVYQESAHSFVLKTPKGVLLNSFQVALKSVLFYGPYIVFIEKTDFEQADELKFIDLRYAKINLGNAPLPVFTLPLNVVDHDFSINIVGGRLMVNNNFEIHPNQLHFLAKMQQVLFNTSVALVDDSTYESAADLVSEIYTYQEAALKAQGENFARQMQEQFASAGFVAARQSDLENQASPLQRAELTPLIEKALADGELTDVEHEALSKESRVGTELVKANAGLSHYKKASTRVRLLWEYMKRPRVEGSPKLRNSLLTLAFAGTPEDRARTRDLIKGNLVDTFDSLRNSKLARYGSYSIGAVLAASLASSEHTNFFYAVNDMVSASYQHFQGYLEHIDYGKNYAELSKDAFVTSTTGIFHVPDAYLTDGKWWKFSYGITSMLFTWIVMPLFTFHILVNSVYGFFKVKKAYKPNERKAFALLRAIRVAAIRDRRDYIQVRAEAEEKVSGSKLNDITREDIEMLKAHIQILEKDEKDRASILFKAAGAGYRSTKKGFGKVIDYSKKVISKVSIKTPKAAGDLAQLLVMAASYRTVIKFTIGFWNTFYIPRTSLIFPSRWLMAIAYPNFVGVAFQPKKEYTLPSSYNRGLDGWGKTTKMFLSRRISKRNSFLNALMVSKSSLQQLNKYETVLRKVEAKTIEFAMKKAQVALFRSIDDPERLSEIFDSRGKNGSITTGVQSLYDPKLSGVLTSKERTFFRSYLTHTYNDILKKFFTKLDESDALSELQDVDSAAFGDQLRRGVRSGEISVSSTTSGKVTEAFENAKASLDFEDIHSRVEKDVSSTLKMLTRIKLNFQHKLLKTINPHNFFFQRTIIADAKKEDANAVERATRAIYTDLKTSIPIGIASILVLYAGVDTGLLMPFDPEGYSTETHTNFFSNKLFYAGLLPGLLYGFLGAAWVKVQMDNRVDALQGFDETALFQDSKRGFWRYFGKNMFKNPKNKWVDNQLYNLLMVFSNFPSFIPTTLAFQYIGMGRFDLGAFLSSMLVMTVTMLGGMGLKLDQAFELSKSWVSSQIPRKLRAHPAAQDYIQKRMTRERFKFTLGENAYDIAIQENIAGSMFSFKDSDYIGTRGMLRLVFGGDTPTAILSGGLDRVGNVLDAVIPQGSNVTNAIDQLFTYNYEAFERFPQRLVELNPTSDRLFENPNLPINAVGEFLGKAFGATLTLGTFALAPYAASFTFHRFKEEWLKRRGFTAFLRRNGENAQRELDQIKAEQAELTEGQITNETYASRPTVDGEVRSTAIQGQTEMEYETVLSCGQILTN